MSRDAADREGGLLEEQVRAFLVEHPPPGLEPEEFFSAQFDHGLAFVHHPVGLGGLGMARWRQRSVDEQLRAAGAKSAALRNPIGVGMGIPTVERHGTLDQLRRYARPAFTCEEIWCQLFSEPGSGSDLAGLSTRAERDGHEWIVNGQKVWTSMGHLARVGMLLARTDPDAPKHRGLSFFLVDMATTGVEVRPLRQMTGEAEFNEVFLTDVRVPDAHRLGELGQGWQVTMTTLMNERVVLTGNTVGGSRVERLLESLVERDGSGDAVLRDELVRRYAESKVVRWTSIRARASASRGPGAEVSIGKLMQTMHNRRTQETAIAALGPRGMAWQADDLAGAAVVAGFLRAQGNTIEGGTSNIQRNLLGERVLGLPREPGPAADVPWSQLPRNG